MGKKTVIYLIRNILNNKCYVGSAVDFDRRKTHHKSLLNKGKHHSIHLQRAWDKAGENNFIFEIIETVIGKSKLIEREQYYLDLYKTYNYKNGYNICKIAGSTLGYKMSEKTKDKMRLSHTGIKRGPTSLEAKKNISQAQLKRDHTQSTRKRLKTMLSKDKDIFKKIARKSAKTQKINGLNKGVNNPNSNTNDVLIFNELNKIVYVTNNLEFNMLCEKNNLPVRALLKSKRSNGEYKLYLNQKPINKGFFKYKGWYCKYKNK